MALTCLDLDIEIREISLKERPACLYKISPKGTVPVLQIKNKVIDESIEIMKWAISGCSSPNLGIDNASHLKLIEINDLEFKNWLDRYKYYDRYLDYPKDYYKEKCSFYLNEYENLLQSNEYLFSPNISFADMAIVPFVRQYASVDFEHFKTSYHRLNKWLNMIISSNLFQSIMKKYPLWKSGNKPMIVNFNHYE